MADKPGKESISKKSQLDQEDGDRAREEVSGVELQLKRIADALERLPNAIVSKHA